MENMKNFWQFCKEHAAAFLITGIAVVTVLLIIIVFVLFASRDTSRKVIIEDIKGSAFILKTDGQINANKKMSLESGDVLITSAAAMVKLAIDKDKYVYIEPETTLYIYYTETADKGSVVVNISEGAAVCRLDSKLKSGQAFEVRTPNGVVSASGTVFRTQFRYFDSYHGYKGTKMTDVQCAQGTVNVQLYDDYATPVDTLKTVSERKSARLVTAAELSRYDLLNSDTNLTAIPDAALETLIRISTERDLGFTLSELNGAYQIMLNNESKGEEEEDNALFTLPDEPPEPVTTAPPQQITAVSSSTTTAPVTTSATTTTPITTTSATTTTPITTTTVTTTTPITTTSVTTTTPITTTSVTTTTPITTTSVTTTTPITTTVTTTTPVTAAPPESAPSGADGTSAAVPGESTVITVPSAETSKATTSVTTSVPWWEIVNSAALTSE